MSLNGKTAVIIPACIDAARATAQDFAKRGARIVIVDRKSDELDKLACELRELSRELMVVEADTVNPVELNKAAQQCGQMYPSIEILVTAHLQVDVCSLENSTYDSWRRSVEVNLLGPVFAAKAFLPLLKAASGAAIVHISSFDGIFGNPKIPSYSAAKGGIVPLTHVMADELSPYGIRVNTVARGLTTTPDEDDNPAFAPLIAETPLGRPCRPAEIAATVRFLASEDASYITGAVFVVDGGRTGITPGTRHLNLDQKKS